MNLKTHSIKRTEEEYLIFKKNNPRELFTLIIDFIKIVGLIILIVFGSIAIYNDYQISIKLLIISTILLFIFWLLTIKTKEIIILLKRMIKPIVRIENSIIYIQNIEGKTIKLKTENIRSIEGKLCTEIKRFSSGHPKKIFYTEISMSSKKGHNLIIDIINPSRLFFANEIEDLRELKKKTKEFGRILSKELNVQFFLEKNKSFR